MDTYNNKYLELQVKINKRILQKELLHNKRIIKRFSNTINCVGSVSQTTVTTLQRKKETYA